MRFKGIILLIILLFALPAPLFGTEEYAERTGKDCQVCHVDPAGGVELTPEGEAFRKSLQTEGLYQPRSTLQRVFRLIIGYLHMMTAVIWFGTILYVHIFLKPAYAAKGLPKGELILGWSSMIVMGITGVILTIVRVPSWDALFHTRFGILLSIKIGLFLVMVTSAAVVTFIIGPRMRRALQRGFQQSKGDMTMEEIARFDGKEGRAAYIAYRGTIYDVSASKLWQGGSHVRRHQAGLDLTDVLKQAPHGEDTVTAMPVVGKLLEAKEKAGKPPHESVFYVIAYMNLVLVFVIMFVIALWRW